jgi:ornithine carbamoyltransferase
MTAGADRFRASDPRHFLDINRLEPAALRRILDLATALKRGGMDRPQQALLAGQTLAMIFEKPSTRTRVSFEVGMQQLGGHVVVLTDADSQLGRGESMADTARVLSRYVDAIMIRTTDHARLDELVRYASVPVINGLTDDSHPCQIMADIMTYEEHRAGITGRSVAWCGDANNVARSWGHAAVRFGFRLRLACPEPLRPADVATWLRCEGGDVTFTGTAAEAVESADLVVTDTWFSMGIEEGARRYDLLAPYRVDAALMGRARPDALFMHCLPVKRGQEVTAEVIDGPQSVVWDEAENRLHVQKGILAWCLENARRQGA